MKKKRNSNNARRNAEYWRKRTLQNELRASLMGKKLLKEYEAAYLRAYKKLEREINRMATKARVSTDELSNTEKWEYTRMINFKEIIREELTASGFELTEKTEKQLTDIYEATLKSNAEAFGATYVRPNKFQVKASVNEVYHGSNYSKRIWKNTSAIASRIETDIERLITTGAAPQAIKKAIQKDFNTAYYNADRLVQTEATRVFTNANMESYRRYGLDEVEYLAEHDACPHCKAKQGKIYEVEKAPQPPLHPFCRCALAPYFKD